MTVGILLSLSAVSMRSMAIVVALAAVLPGLAHAQPQAPRRNDGWPCVGTVSPEYIRMAEATGGSVLLFKPGEIGGAADGMVASDAHGEAVVRATSHLDRGSYQFEVPVDSTMESVYFFVTVQCLEAVTLVRPSGEELPTDAPGLGYHRFEAVRLFTVREPTAGMWKVNVTGRGYFSLIVKGRTDLRLSGAAFRAAGAPRKGEAARGTVQELRAKLCGVAGQPAFQFISSDVTPIQILNVELQRE